MCLTLLCYKACWGMHQINVASSCDHSDLTISWTGEFVIYSREQSLNRTRCRHSCMRVRGMDIPSRKLTTLVMQGVRSMLHAHAATLPTVADS